jgi:hypothetical protein
MSVGTAQAKETGHLVNDRYRVNKHKKIGVLQETSFVRRSLIFQDEADARVDEWVAAPAYYDIMQSAISEEQYRKTEPDDAIEALDALWVICQQRSL